MMQAYCKAIHESNVNSSATAQKYIKRSVLGSVGSQHNIMPRQPVLSSRSVDIDAVGTRTYRAATSDDIIDEQHQLIHKIYMAAKVLKRDVKSAQVRQRVQMRMPRVMSAPPIQREKNFSPSLEDMVDTIDATTEENDIDVADLDCLVKEQWTWKNHDISDGDFIVGKKRELKPVIVETTAPTKEIPKEKGKWLNFGGGSQQSPRPGVVNAFTTSDDENKYFRVDSATGTHIAMQLAKGNSVRIGINGEKPSDSSRLENRSQDDDFYTTQPFDFSLCWDDLVEKEKCKVKTPFKCSKPETSSELSTKSIITDDEITDENSRPLSRLLSTPNGAEPLYDVKVERRGKLGLISREVRSAGIVPRKFRDYADKEFDPDMLTVDDIVQKTVLSGNRENYLRPFAFNSANYEYMQHNYRDYLSPNNVSVPIKSQTKTVTLASNMNIVTKKPTYIQRSASAIQRNSSGSPSVLSSLYVHNMDNQNKYFDKKRPSTASTVPSTRIRHHFDKVHEDIFSPKDVIKADKPPGSQTAKEFIQIAQALNVKDGNTAAVSNKEVILNYDRNEKGLNGKKMTSAGRPRKVPGAVTNSRKVSTENNQNSNFAQDSFIIPVPLHLPNSNALNDVVIRTKPLETKAPANSPPSSPQLRRYMQLNIPSASEDITTQHE